MHVRDRIHSGIPPATMWKSIKPTLLIVDQIAIRLGEAEGEIVASDRSPTHDAHCPGTSHHSQYMNNLALDLAFWSRPSKAIKVEKALRAECKFADMRSDFPARKSTPKLQQDANVSKSSHEFYCPTATVSHE